jgi:hypothetical protein
MKLTVSHIAIIAGIVTLVACSTQPSPDKPAKQPILPGVVRVLCRLDSAQTDIRYFKTLCHERLQDTPICAYTLHAIDLIEALGLPRSLEDSCEYKYARVYLAYRPNNGFKMYVVPVDSADLSGTNPAKWKPGIDILLDSSGRGIPPKRKLRAGETEFVLDLNAPCPNTCATNDVLQQ